MDKTTTRMHVQNTLRMENAELVALGIPGMDVDSQNSLIKSLLLFTFGCGWGGGYSGMYFFTSVYPSSMVQMATSC
jgi:hypothetical protein